MIPSSNAPFCGFNSIYAVCLIVGWLVLSHPLACRYGCHYFLCFDERLFNDLYDTHMDDDRYRILAVVVTGCNFDDFMLNCFRLYCLIVFCAAWAGLTTP
jgi:hypothetical protein